MMMRTNMRLSRPVAMPLRADSSENSTTAGTNTLRRPMRSDRPPMNIAEMPQATARTPTRSPMF